MPELKRIILPTDLSPEAGCAVPFAAELARRYGGWIDLVHSFEELPYSEFNYGWLGPAHLEWIEQARDARETQLNTLAASISSLSQRITRPFMYAGNAVEAIVEHARRESADCIVMGTHGRAGFSHVMFGSVMERVLQRSPCPILAVKPGQDLSMQIKNVVLATDFSANSDAARPFALELTRKFGATLHVVHVFENDVLYAQNAGPVMPHALQERMATQQAWHAERLRNYAEQVGARDFGVIHLLSRGNPAVKIASYASAIDADFIVMATHGRTGLPHFLIGSVAECVVRSAPCPVLCVKPETIVSGRVEDRTSKAAV